MKLGLGTVQFGLDYGISNKNMKVSEEEASNILDIAKSAGVDTIDTATSYGNSEEMLGRLLSNAGGYKIVTKTPVLDGEANKKENIQEAFYRSLEKLNRESIYGLLVHHSSDLTGEEGDIVLDAITDLKKSRKVKKIGVSVYDGQSIDEILELFTPDIIQLPVSIADQRLIRSGYLKKLKQKGVEIHARSIFLQGLLLMPPENISHFFDEIKYQLISIRDRSRELGFSMLETCIKFVNNCTEIDRIIIGITSASEMQEVVKVFMEEKTIDDSFNDLYVRNEDYLNPANWHVNS